MIKGKFVYMSPEQSLAKKLDKRSDIFAIGSRSTKMITGTNPFPQSNIVLTWSGAAVRTRRSPEYDAAYPVRSHHPPRRWPRTATAATRTRRDARRLAAHPWCAAPDG